ncbi:MAG: CPXCG motif-containing cysteine-rich protein [Verrucomicrobia bacterium]|nr:CPXCG motif-containing cysteine-rich protein [Verrucomicrobiota bacterium]
MNWLVDAEILCPFCGEAFTAEIDTSQGDYETVQDCEICCRPFRLEVRCAPGRLESLDALPE